jgi:hypothetical protein
VALQTAAAISHLIVRMREMKRAELHGTNVLSLAVSHFQLTDYADRSVLQFKLELKRRFGVLERYDQSPATISARTSCTRSSEEYGEKSRIVTIPLMS